MNIVKILAEADPGKYISNEGGALDDTIKVVINWAVGVLGLVAVVIIIIGGVTYMTSNGDSAKVKRGRDTILYGIIGLIICALAYAIVNFALTAIGN